MENKLPIELSNDLQTILDSKKSIVAASNATFFAEVINKISSKLLSQKFIFWPDGILSYVISYKLKKVPGRLLLERVLEDSKILNKKICFIGDSFHDKIALLGEVDWKLISVSYGTAKEISREINDNLGDIVVINLPSPKQEELAVILSENNPLSKFYCTGGALNMLLGEEKIVPEIFNKTGLEWLWRLRTDTKRRLRRLINILTFLPMGIYRFRKTFYHEKT